MCQSLFWEALGLAMTLTGNITAIIQAIMEQHWKYGDINQKKKQLVLIKLRYEQE